MIFQDKSKEVPKLSSNLPKRPKPKRHMFGLTVKIFLGLAVLFWTFGAIHAFNTGNVAAAPIHKQHKKPPNFATSVGAQTFAKEFVKQYLTWNKDNEQDHANRLKPYLIDGLDSQAGLIFSNMADDSTANELSVWKVTSTGNNTANIIVKAQQTLTGTVETTATVGKGKNKKKVTQPVPKTYGPYTRFISVPIITNGKSFLVNDIPNYVPAPKKPHIQESHNTKATVSNNQVVNSIQSFTNTFFNVYVSGTDAQLSYYTDGLDLKVLGNGFSFNQIQDLKVYKSKPGYKVDVSVLYEETQSKAQIVQSYEIKVINKNNRWLIQSFKNQ